MTTRKTARPVVRAARQSARRPIPDEVPTAPAPSKRRARAVPDVPTAPPRVVHESAVVRPGLVPRGR